MKAKDSIYFVPADSPVLPSKYDVRVRLRYLTRGEITLQELKKHKESLPDDTNFAEQRDYEALVTDQISEGAAAEVPPPVTNGSIVH